MMAGTKDLDFELKMCGKKVYVTYFELWNKPGFDEQPIRELMKQTGKDEGGHQDVHPSSTQNCGKRTAG
ncbi:hypothetical protein OMP38_16250 [Cohnella ginsengisoli]|uniref:Uncharacterized protein n=1 Tax=Cohnella ginsengisoli TaxID=425004 RepID=A0A9X4QP28_9BACL|nr:hypothetical protein [Cohnella ginsengisoli]MDG0792245.1 hypothetical protein [Cohnella ginsengisoli]